MEDSAGTVKNKSMRKSQKKQIEDILKLLDQAHTAIRKALETQNAEIAQTLLEQMQDSAIQMGGMIEEALGEDFATVGMLEAYCEQIYQTYEMIRQRQPLNPNKLHKNLQKTLIRIENSVKNDISVRTSAVFLPYKASMWDSLESVWKAADADLDCDAYVIPIPYYDKNADGTFGEMHYEGDEFPADVPVTGYEDYDFEENRPDIIFIHNPYDECNHVTSVHPFFYIKNLKNFADKIVYIPYFILGEDVYESVCVTPGTVFTDGMIAHSAPAKEDYIRYLKKFYLENAEVQGKAAEKEVEKMLHKKILPLGSPKIDKVVNGRREDYTLPEAWKKKLAGKKAVLYNTGVSGILHGNEQELIKIQDTINYFAGRDDMVLWWRPHPLSGSTMQSMRPQLFEAYQAIVEEYKRSGIGIYDDTADLHRALLWTDMYYGDDSSLIYLYGVQGKPIVRQNNECLMQDREAVEDKSIEYQASCCHGGEVYFTATKFNRLYRWNIESGTISDMGRVPQEYEIESSLYSNLICRRGKLWLIPSTARMLSAYDLSAESWEQYELPERIKCSVEADGKIYMISSDYHSLWIMDTDTEKLDRKEIVYLTENRFPISEGTYNDDLYLIQNKLYYLIAYSNMLVMYDLEQNRAEVVPIGTEENQYRRMLCKAGKFCFLPADTASRIVCWDGVKMRESGKDAYPPDFSFQWGFSQAIWKDGEILLFPMKGNMILKLLEEDMRIEKVLEFENSLDIESLQLLPDGGAIFLSSKSGMDCSITVLDKYGQILKRFAAVCADSDKPDLSRLFERLENEKYRSRWSFMLAESGQYDLSDICDVLGEMAVSDRFRREQDYYRSLYANSDGTAGSHIWEALKAW